MGNIVESIFAFTTEKFNHALLTRPYTSKNKIIFPYDKRTKDYSISEFRKFSPHSKLPPQKLNEILDLLSRTRNHDANMDCTTCLVFSLVIFVLLVITVVPFFLIMMNGKAFEDIGTWFLMLFGFFLLLSLVACVCYRFDTTNEEKRMELRELETQQVLEAYNQKEFLAKNSKWSCGYGGSYLIFEDFGPGDLGQEKSGEKMKKVIGVKRSLVKIIRRL